MELAGTRSKPLRPAATPFLEGNSKTDDDEEDMAPQSPQGALADMAVRVLMKLLYAARVARYDLLRPIAALARRLTRWTKRCDRKLYRLMCYVYATIHKRMRGYVGDRITDCSLCVFSDADLAGDHEDSKSTSGIFMVIIGPRTLFPLSAVSKRQKAVSHSTTEAEMIAAEMALREEGLPMSTLWDILLDMFSSCEGKPSLRKQNQNNTEQQQQMSSLFYFGDNQATLKIIKSGRTQKLRHVARTHRINIDWLHELYKEAIVNIRYVETKYMPADIFTKAFTSKMKWNHVAYLIGLCNCSKNNVPTVSPAAICLRATTGAHLVGR